MKKKKRETTRPPRPKESVKAKSDGDEEYERLNELFKRLMEDGISVEEFKARLLPFMEASQAFEEYVFDKCMKKL